jgi:hypothetical protein
MPDHVSCPRCGCACRVQPHDHAHCVQCFTSFRPSRVQSRECPHCGEPFASLLGAGTEAGRFCAACGQYEGFPDANTNPLDAALARGFGKCRLSDLQRADLARWAYYNLGAQMTSQRPGDCMYPAAAYYARTGPRLPYVCKCGQLSGDEKACDACRDLARAPQGAR